MNYQKGQSLIELVVALGVFVIVISALAYLILNSYVAGRLAQEITQANFLAEEGLEAIRSIRDNNWQDLTDGNYRLDKSSGNWRLILGSETIDGKFTRVIKIEKVNPDNPDRKKITSQVTWEFTESKFQETNLVTYLTNWQKISVEIRKPQSYSDPPPSRTSNPQYAYDLSGDTSATTAYDSKKSPSITFFNWQLKTQPNPYTSLVLKYRYNAEGAIDDTYAVAYSITGCAGIFTYIISPTSAFASDTTISVNLSPGQDLSKLCLRIDTNQVGPKDRKNLYTRDIWSEGTY